MLTLLTAGAMGACTGVLAPESDVAMIVTVGLVVLAAVMVGFTGVDQFKGNTKQTGDKVKDAVKH
jgi:hypothetical protein